jgi:predicted Zn finger-like uncharacterized protein
MRITCPNCGAQYEVDDALIPEAGRDVQCSNCGKGWFQPKNPEPPLAGEEPETTAELAEAEAAPLPEDEHRDEDDRPAEFAPPDEPEPVAGPDTADEVAPAAREDDERETSIDAEDEDEPLAAAPAAVQRKPDESVLSVLREEAEREIAQRRQDAGAIESQPDLGLSELPQRRTGPSEADIAAGAAVAASARRDLLPDIDEINSTLRPDAVRGAAVAGEAETSVEDGRRRGFRMGFGLMLLIAAVLIGLYIAAGWLATVVPALEPFLIGYVETANAFRAWIDGLLARGVDAMSG